MFTALPPEIVLQILSYLPVSSCSALSATSHTWNVFFAENEMVIYREAAFLHGFADRRTALPDPTVLGERYSYRVLQPGMSWKSLCKTRTRVRNSWNGFASSTIVPLPLKVTNYIAPPDRVHRIKVDERRRLIMTTSQKGGLFVMDIDSGSALFSLSPIYVHDYAHIEYSEGYIIFDRMDSSREVWRLQEIDPTPTPVDAASRPDQEQLEQFRVAMHVARRLQSASTPDSPTLRGCFEPHALLMAPEETRASRFVYPTLLSTASERAYLWDVPTGRLVEVIERVDILPSGNPPASQNASETEDGAHPEEYHEDDLSPWLSDHLGELVYVDHSADCIFLAGSYAVRVFAKSRHTDNAQPTSSTSNTHPGRWCSTCGLFVYALLRYQVDVNMREWPDDHHKLIDRVVAVHVSPCGSHFAALLGGCRLLIVTNFRHVAGDPRSRDHERSLYERTLDIQLGSPRTARSIYLAYEGGDGGEGRIAVVTSSAVFIIIVPPFEALTLSSEPPKICITRVKSLINPSCLSSVSCLMLSDTGLFLNWDPVEDSSSDSDGEFMQQGWEESLENSLRDIGRLDEECVDHYSNGDMLVAPDIIANDTDVSMVYAVNFLPSDT
ncbi:hypothetical protein NLJ89_g10502 [Agrocybe chaxingu]|uniref:F-box domain-containing protein n=1 Tax=Agrocybe chaxingu TaxID=84603 RepID=A0A9W8JQH5_9AGAR|nr:hypothetical protein NLJ89_g10502 [Agrocybe chaxingu]